MESAILQLILVGAQIFKEERARYYQNKANDLLKVIEQVEDTEFYKKDMEAKGIAERELGKNTMGLYQEFITEAKKK